MGGGGGGHIRVLKFLFEDVQRGFFLMGFVKIYVIHALITETDHISKISVFCMLMEEKVKN